MFQCAINMGTFFILLWLFYISADQFVGIETFWDLNTGVLNVIGKLNQMIVDILEQKATIFETLNWCYQQIKIIKNREPTAQVTNNWRYQ